MTRGTRAARQVGRAGLAGLAAVALLTGCAQPSDTAAAPVGQESAPTAAPAPTATPAPGSALEAFGAAAPLTQAPQPRQVAAVAAPTTVRIPSIGVESALTDLGVAADGTIEVPADYDVAGWFTEGPAPGARGPAVILGHVDSRSGPAVFAEVDTLGAGDLIEVDRADGSTVAFRVERLEQVPKDQFPSAAVYGPVPGPALRLITCGGQFDGSTGHYRDNVVVFAAPVV